MLYVAVSKFSVISGRFGTKQLNVFLKDTPPPLDHLTLSPLGYEYDLHLPQDQNCLNKTRICVTRCNDFSFLVHS